MSNNKYNGTKAFLIARVSDPSQRDALPAQELRLKEYATKLKLNYDYRCFDETAYKEDRQKFQEIVTEIQKYPDFCIIVFDKIDRFTRDGSSEIVRIFKDMVKDGRIELHFPSDGLIIHKDSPACDKTRLGMGMVFGEYYSAAISDNVKRRFNQKIHDGEWPGKAPVGYMNIIEGKDKNIVPDPERRNYIVETFRLRAQGASYRAIAKTLREDGFTSNMKVPRPITQSQIEAILENPFYYGVMRYNGGFYPHKYEPLITKMLFDKAKAASDARAWNKTKTAVKNHFTFNGILRCANCGCSMSSYNKKGHVYLHCTKAKGNGCPQKNIPESVVMEQVFELLDRLHIGQDVVEQALESLKNEHDNQQTYYAGALEKARHEYRKYKNRLETLYADRLDGRITVEEYDKYATEYRNMVEELDDRIVRLSNDDKSFEIKAGYLLELADKAKTLFENSQPEEKTKLLKLLVANLEINQKRLQFNLLKPFDMLIEPLQNGNWLPGLDSNQQPRS